MNLVQELRQIVAKRERKKARAEAAERRLKARQLEKSLRAAAAEQPAERGAEARAAEMARDIFRIAKDAASDGDQLTLGFDVASVDPAWALANWRRWRREGFPMGVLRSSGPRYFCRYRAGLDITPGIAMAIRRLLLKQGFNVALHTPRDPARDICGLSVSW